MTILITGNTGYVGSVLTEQLLQNNPNRKVIGYDVGFFAESIPEGFAAPEENIRQYFNDIRVCDGASEIWNSEQQLDSVVHLAAISNDPMGKEFEQVTRDINIRASLSFAKFAKKHGVKKFVFASSCSLYGAGGSSAKKEEDSLNPLTAYAESKSEVEKGLQELADEQFQVVCLRFATACGASPRIRLDLVLNDFVASALTQGKIEVLSDGSPYRPLIHIKDMARAIEWALSFEPQNYFLIVNAGSDTWNYQIKDLAQTVAELLPNTTYSVNPDASPDKRSYCVDFSLFKSLAPDHQPQIDLATAVMEIYDHLKKIGFNDQNFRQSNLVRLHHLRRLIDSLKLNNQLYWQSENWQQQLFSFVQKHKN